MTIEDVVSVEVTPNSELMIVLEGGGKPEYVHVYRGAAGVYWEEDKRGFRSTPMKEWPHSKWAAQILSVVQSELGVTLRFSPNVQWRGVPASEQKAILSQSAV